MLMVLEIKFLMNRKGITNNRIEEILTDTTFLMIINSSKMLQLAIITSNIRQVVDQFQQTWQLEIAENKKQDTNNHNLNPLDSIT